MIKNENENKKSNTRFFITLIAVVASLIVMRVAFIDWINVSGVSMLPTLQEGEMVLVNKLKHTSNALEYGDIVIVQEPRSGMQLVKRVVGKAGDTVGIRNSIVYVNGDARDETYTMPEPFMDMNPVTVEPDSIFVMGDNRNHSNDSREIGSIPNEKIVGGAICVLFPFEKARAL